MIRCHWSFYHLMMWDSCWSGEGEWKVLSEWRQRIVINAALFSPSSTTTKSSICLRWMRWWWWWRNQQPTLASLRSYPPPIRNSFDLLLLNLHIYNIQKNLKNLPNPNRKHTAWIILDVFKRDTNTTKRRLAAAEEKLLSCILRNTEKNTNHKELSHKERSCLRRKKNKHD